MIAVSFSNRSLLLASGSLIGLLCAATLPSYAYAQAAPAVSKPAVKVSTGKTVRLAQNDAPVPPAAGPAAATGPGRPAVASGEAKVRPEQIVVTGFRRSLESALNRKRKSNLQIESVAPEDIGKLPDTNVAEALQRLPGVQIDRSASGEGTAVLIDGLRYNLTTLNGDVFLTGREFYSSGEAANNGAGANVQYNSLQGIPSEEIGGIDVYKSPKASLTEGGLGGIIDLRTRDPLTQQVGLSLAGNFRESISTGTKNWTPNGTLVVGYKVNDDLAFTASFSYDDLHTQTNEVQDYNRSGWNVTDSANILTGGPLTADQYTTIPHSYIQPQLEYFTNIDDSRKDIGASFGAAYRISDSIKTYFNWFYSHEDDTNTQFANKLYFNGGANTPPTGIDATQPYSIDGNNVLQNGTFVASGAETASLYQNVVTQANNVQYKTFFDNGGPLRASLQAAYAYATYDSEAAQADVEHGLYLYNNGTQAAQPTAPGCNNGGGTCGTGLGNAPYEFSYSNGGTSGLPTYSYLAPFQNILSNPAYATFKSNWAWADHNTGRNYAIRADGEYDVPFIKAAAPMTLSFGVRYASRTEDVAHDKYLIDGQESNGLLAGGVGTPNSGPYLYYQDPGYCSGGGPNGGCGQGTTYIPFSTATSNPGLVNTVKSFSGPTMIVKNLSSLSNPATYLDSVWKDAGVPNNTERPFEDTLSSFGVTERTTAGYVMSDLGAPDDRFHVNFGVRFVDTDLTIDGSAAAENPSYYGTAPWNGVNSNNVPFSRDRNYQDLLPSLNFVLDVTDDQKLRFSAARVVSPADLAALGLGDSFNFTRGTAQPTSVHKTTSSGATTGFYFDGGSSGNPNLDPYRATQTAISYEYYFAKGAVVSAEGFYKQVDSFEVYENLPTLVMDDFGGTIANVTTPENAGHGQISGVELSLQYIMDGRYGPWLEGLGFAGNYTLADSVSDQKTSFSANAPIPGVARHAVTATLFYEHDGFTARGSYSWRSTSLNDGIGGSTFTFDNKTYEVFQAPYGQLDIQLGYDINSKLGLVFSAQNVSGAAQHTYLQYANEPFTYDYSGRRFFLGMKFKL
jgi:iron complex outermembrane receptor protein